MATMSAANANSAVANSGGNNNAAPTQSGQALGALITTVDACGSNGQKVVDAIISRYERFKDPEIQSIVQGLKRTTLAENVRNMLSIGGGRQGAINGVAGEVKNNQQSMINSADCYCKIQAGCSNYTSLGWPDNMNTSLPTNRGGASGSMVLAYVLTSVMHDLNSVTLRALRCTP